MDNREKLELLRDTVLAAAQRSAEETEAQTKKLIGDTVASEKKRLADEIAEIKTISYDETRARDEKDLIAKEAKLKKSFLVRREKYMNELFSELEKKLTEFRSTEKYGEYLKNAYESAVKDFGAPDIAYCMKDENELVASVFPSLSVEEDDSVKLGGIIFRKGNLLLDFSFNSRLEKERSDFINSGKLRSE